MMMPKLKVVKGVPTVSLSSRASWFGSGGALRAFLADGPADRHWCVTSPRAIQKMVPQGPYPFPPIADKGQFERSL